MKTRYLVAACLSIAAGAAEAQLYAINGTATLYEVSTSDASRTLVGGGGVATLVGGLEYNPTSDSFWALDAGSGSNLRSINRATGINTVIGPTGLDFVFEGALQLAPDGTLYGANSDSASSPKIFKLNPATGAATVIGTLPGAPRDINGLAWRSDNMLIGLDRPTNSLIAINPSTLAVTTVVSLGFTVGSIGGMANIDYSSAYLVNDTNDLYQIDLFTGASTFIGNSTGLDALTALAYVPVPAPASGLAIGLGGLAFASRRRR